MTKITKQKFYDNRAIMTILLLFVFSSFSAPAAFGDSDSIAVSFSVYDTGQTNSSLNLTANQSTTINATNTTNAYFTFTTRSNVTNGSVSFYYTDENIKGTNGTGTLDALGNFVDIEVSSAINSNFSNGTIRIYYANSDLVPNDYVFAESGLRLYFWNSTLGNWTLESTQGVDTDNNYVWANITHLSLFGIFGTKVELSYSDSPEDAVSSGNSGGGGISCAEDWVCGEWLECKDGAQTRVCYYSGNCGTISSKPITNQKCTIEPMAAAQLQQAAIAPMPAPTAAAVASATPASRKIVPLGTSIAVLAVILALIMVILYATSKKYKRHK